MMKRYLIGLCLFCLSFPLYAHKPSVIVTDTEQKIYKTLLPSLTQFFAVKTGEREELARDDAIALDQHHVVADCNVATMGDFAILGVHLKPHQAIMDYQDPNKDFCIFSINDAQLTPVTMRPSKSLKPNEKFYVVILKDAHIKTSLQGNIVKLSTVNNSSYIETSIPLTPSTTDGLYDSDGKLIGITTDKMTANNHGLAIPAETLLNVHHSA